MSKFFGKTWWGQQWLNSLTNIDYSNRLPRGSIYARNGSVVSLSIDGYTIKAKVSGSLPKPYDVTVAVPPFTLPEIKSLVRAISKKPVIVSKLLNRELDIELLKIAEQCGLKVFPRQWSDLKMNCSCPDWAVPCKHLAAVIYKISIEIDNNPFLVFQLHRMDLTEELKKENIYLPQQGTESVPLLKALLLPEEELKNSKQKPVNKRTDQPNEGPPETAYDKLNFSILGPLHESLVALLQDTPAFYQNPGNFREKYAAAIRKTVNNAQKILSGKADPEDFFPVGAFTKKQLRDSGQPGFPVNYHTDAALQIHENNSAGVLVNNELKVQPGTFLSALWKLPEDRLPDYRPSVAAMRSSLLLAMNLVANGAMVPQVFRLQNEQTAVRWLPALLSKEVKTLVHKLEEMLPDNILYYTGKSSTAISKDAAVHLLSAWLNLLVHGLCNHSAGDVFLDLFFSSYAYAFNGPGQQAISGGIQAWLQRYYFTQGKYKPVIVVEELSNERFLVSIHIQESEKPLEQGTPLRNVLTLKMYQDQRFVILQSLAHLSTFIPGLDEYINTKGEELIVMNTEQFVPFLMQAIPAIRLLDVNILLPLSLQHILKPRASIRIKQQAKEAAGFMRLDKLLDFDWQVAIGDTLLDEAAFRKLLKSSEGLIKYKTGYVYVDAADLEKIHKHFTASRALTAFELLRSALSNDYYGASVEMTDEVKQLIKDLTDNEPVPLPRDVRASLRPYQHRGYSWMYRNAQIGFGAVIADDMGLGKTIQVITTLVKFKEEGLLGKEKALVIAPTGLLTNWQAEIEKFAPALQYKLYHGTARKSDKKESYDVLLTSYGIARSDADVLKKMKWHVVVTDEAQNIKNQETSQSKAIKSIPAHTFIAMSGTPVENRLSELWSILDFANRGLLGTLPEFRKNFAYPIQNQHDQEAAAKLKAITAPFLLRRLKSDKSIISDLPDKIEIDSYSHLVKEQAALYEKTLHKALQTIEAVKQTDQKSLFVRQGLVLQMILALKQICNHPTQFLKNKVMDASLSGKTGLLFEKLEIIRESNEKVLVFTQFTEMADLLKHFITERFGEAPLFYHGGCTIKQRKQMVEAFQHDPAEKIFILSLKAAGTGLNLTAASHVIHYDLWWNPAVEAQATDRAYRIGQKSDVMVHRFITKGTFEERINEMIQHKKALADLTVATGEGWIGNLSNKELKEMFTLAK